MADRALGQASSIYARLSTAQAGVTVTLIDSLGTLVVLNAPAEVHRSNIWRFDTPVLDIPGVWQARWYRDNEPEPRVVQDFTVDTQPFAGISVFDVRAAASRRVEDATHIGFVSDAHGDTLIDETVIGGSGNYKMWWVIIDEPGLITPRRVQTFTGSGFTLSPSFDWPVESGTRYLLTPISPHEIDTALRTTMSELSPYARIETSFSNLVAEAGSETGTSTLTLPRGLQAVHRVATNDVTLPTQVWTMLSGRRMNILTDTGVLSLEGTRPAGIPVWEDSILEFDSGAVIARVVSILHASRAGGQASDIDENLRRQMASMDEYMELRRRGTGRPLSGQKHVIE